ECRILPAATVELDAVNDAQLPDDPVLLNPVWHALIGPQARFAEGARGTGDAGAGGSLALRYAADVSLFAAVRDWNDEPSAWRALADLVGPGNPVLLTGVLPQAPSGWAELGRDAGVQLVETERLDPRPEPDAIDLGADDVPDMLDLVVRSKPGPFEPRTHELGRYVGVRVDGVLAAMAGMRMRPAGWTEISAVTTDPAYRRRGLASRLVLDLVHGIHADGGRAFIHAAASNVTAIRAYEQLGFALIRRPEFAMFRAPRAGDAGERFGRDVPAGVVG
ncbi:MAG: GNAT family N-acetyltransferase, partial [Pseudoclavibacter sp.]